MSVHQKPNGTWFVQYRVPGKSTPCREYFGVGAAGEQKARERNEEIARGKRSRAPKIAYVYLDEVAQAYLNERKLRGASARWLHETALLLNGKILPALSDKPADAISYTDIVDFTQKTWGHCTLSTRQRYLGYMKALFRFGVENKILKNNPLAKWTKVKEPKRNFRLTVEDLGKILQQAPPHLKWAIQVEWELGARPGPSELFGIKWHDVDWQACTILIRGTKTNESNRVIPITESFRNELLRRAKIAPSEYIIDYRGHPIRKVSKGFKSAALRAGITYDVRMYDIRHLFASTMLAGGADLAAVSKLLGHSTIVTTQQHYYHVLRGEMTRAIRVRPKLDGGNTGISVKGSK